MHIEPKLGRTFIGRLKHGEDLLGALNNFCKEHDIRLGTLSLIGAAQSVTFGYYNQKEQKYETLPPVNKSMEIAFCSGNISLQKGEPMVHAHIEVIDEAGRACGGHLMPGTKIFVAEFKIQEYTGGELNRGQDKQTGLPLWE